ncbi:hypothetical protein SAMN05660836_00808 [Thermodesulforhabdus norvegica]|uniref:Transposase n=2 Tax=Thermodesulforhabdus norvegica TaxID=39841 RepID=A0A1I4S880_9BACT|nr:hypothetical protein SAMN05660836_00808 [Thermodesulforhabdus norvegica]
MVEGKDVKPGRIQMMTASRKKEILLEVLKGHKTVVDMAHEHNVRQSETPQWIDGPTALGTQAIKANPKSTESVYQKEFLRHREEVGEVMLQIDVKNPKPLSPRKRTGVPGKKGASDPGLQGNGQTCPDPRCTRNLESTNLEQLTARSNRLPIDLQSVISVTVIGEPP